MTVNSVRVYRRLLRKVPLIVAPYEGYQKPPTPYPPAAMALRATMRTVGGIDRVASRGYKVAVLGAAGGIGQVRARR